MANAGVDPSRLYSVLIRTGLQTKDPVLYQLLYNLIGTLANLTSNAAADAAGGSTTEETIINNFYQILQGGDGDGDGGGIGPPGSAGAAGATGATGATGTSGIPGQGVATETYVELRSFVPGPQGNAGPIGLRGQDGINNTFFHEEVELQSFNPGPQGTPGNTGPRGGDGQNFIVVTEEVYDQLIPIPQTLGSIPAASCLIYRDTAQTIPVTTETAVVLSDVLYDSPPFWNISDPTRLTVPIGYDGTFIALGQVKWNLVGTGPCWLRVYKNGTDLIAENYVPMVDPSTTIQVAANVEMLATDYLELIIYHGSSNATEDTVPGQAETYFALVMAASVISGAAPVDPPVAGSLSFGTTINTPTSVNLTTLGTVDWWDVIADTVSLQSRQFPHRKLLGAHFIDHWYFYGATGAGTLTTQNSAISRTSTSADDASGNPLSAYNPIVIVFNNTASAVNFGVGFRCKANNDTRTVVFSIHTFSAVVTVDVSLSDGSATPISTTMDSGANANLDKQFTVTFNSSQNYDCFLLVTARVTTNRGFVPNVAIHYAYMT